MADQTALFDTTPYQIEPPAPTEKLSPDRARTLRQAAALAAGRHPLQPVTGHTLRLHPEAAPADDRTAPGRRCGNCWYRSTTSWRSKTFAKCTYGYENATDSRPATDPPRATHSAASDVRGWWPACTDHTYGDPRLSDDAARYVPKSAGGS